MIFEEGEKKKETFFGALVICTLRTGVNVGVAGCFASHKNNQHTENN